MIAHLRGRVAARTATSVVIDVNGVGYLVHVPSSTAAEVPPRGEPLELHTSMQVREDSMTLYGFVESGSREVFELLLTCTGVGPKVALAALSTFSAGALRSAIAADDVVALTSIPGVGKKSAQRLVLELREKLGGIAGELAVAGGTATSTPLGEVREALIALGYSAGEAQQALAGLDPAGTSSTLLREALRSLSRAGATS